jgi:hypothetical protein
VLLSFPKQKGLPSSMSPLSLSAQPLASVGNPSSQVLQSHTTATPQRTGFDAVRNSAYLMADSYTPFNDSLQEQTLVRKQEKPRRINWWQRLLIGAAGLTAGIIGVQCLSTQLVKSQIVQKALTHDSRWVRWPAHIVGIFAQMSVLELISVGVEGLLTLLML